MPEGKTWEVIVVGAGHAGVEAAAAAARMGARTLLLTMNLDTFAKMSCNPAIGGLAKGQIVREVDALGGLMGKIADRTAIQFRLLNRSKGAAVRAPRAQCDPARYTVAAKEALDGVGGLVIRQETVTGIIAESGRVTGVTCDGGAAYRARTVVLCPGTFLSAVLHTGEEIIAGGRSGEGAAGGVSDCLRGLGFPVERLKTGTPPRISARSVDYAGLARQEGDYEPVFFSFASESVVLPQVPCHIAFTNAATHRIIRENLDRAPLYTGQIKSVGPRYCPSIETKVVRFGDKKRHQLFLEPEGLDTDEVYLNGMATSLPRDVQKSMVRSVEGLEKAEIIRYGYAVEYDFVPPTEIYGTLETKRVSGLFFAGQVNGTSGYEEAAGQGLLAGVNAVLAVRGDEGLVLGRHEAYMGVLVDDLVTKGVDEPYRMFTSRAEYRLLLRYDNADVRLRPLGRRLGLVDDDAWARFEKKRREAGDLRRFLARTRSSGATLEKRLSRPGVSIGDVVRDYPDLSSYCAEALALVETDIKYAGYIVRQEAAVERMKKSEAQRIPRGIDYDAMGALRFESREKLKLHRPSTIGQATRIPGVNPADVSILLIHLKRGAP